MTSVHPHERCTCRPPRPTGRWYLSYEADRCGRLIVRSRAELRALEAEVVRIAEQESAFRVGGIRRWIRRWKR